MNILAFPKFVGTDIVGEVMRGGADKVAEAGGIICGGHTIEDDEPKYGLSVFGTVHPDKIVRNEGCKPGDILYYTKKIGTGLQNSALSAGLITDDEFEEVINYMAELNRAGAEAMMIAGVNAATDVTGFGFAGHLYEMVHSSKVSAIIEWDSLPLYDRCLEFSEMYCRPCKTDGIIDWATDFVMKDGRDDEEYDNMMGVLCDPQTSGGLLCSIAPENADKFEEEFLKRCHHEPWKIGKVSADDPGKIKVI